MGGRFEGKVILVTGGSRGIGAAIVRRAVEEGASAVIADLSAPETPQQRVRYVRCDVADRGSVEALFASIGATEGGLDILVNNAGIQRVALTESFSFVPFSSGFAEAASFDLSSPLSAFSARGAFFGPRPRPFTRRAAGRRAAPRSSSPPALRDGDAIGGLAPLRRARRRASRAAHRAF